MNELKINPAEDLFFDYKVREMCGSCKRYGKKATCPPHIASVDYYYKLLVQFSSGILYYKNFIVGDDWKEQGKTSSLEIYNHVIAERNRIWEKGHYFSMAFGAGSCKLCGECTFPCKNPSQSLIPFEAAGINVVKTLEKFNIEIKFPIQKHFYRIGALFYD